MSCFKIYNSDEHPLFVEPFASSSVIKMSFKLQMAELAKMHADFAAENARINKMCEEQKKLREEEEENLK